MRFSSIKQAGAAFLGLTGFFNLVGSYAVYQETQQAFTSYLGSYEVIHSHQCQSQPDFSSSTQQTIAETATSQTLGGFAGVFVSGANRLGAVFGNIAHHAFFPDKSVPFNIHAWPKFYIDQLKQHDVPICAHAQPQTNDDVVALYVDPNLSPAKTGRAIARQLPAIVKHLGR